MWSRSGKSDRPQKQFQSNRRARSLIYYRDFFPILGRGLRAFLIGKFSDINSEFRKFSKHSRLNIFQCDMAH